MTPTELIAKLVALIPPPRLHLTRYSGVFARNSKHRKFVVKDDETIKDDPEHPANSDKKHTKYRPPWACQNKLFIAMTFHEAMHFIQELWLF
jgi:hypothetical protein